jgi:transposase
MADRETWARRVAEWKASGLSSPAYCAGKEFTAGGLRHWAHRLTHGEQRRPRMLVARVVLVKRDGRQARLPAGDRPPEGFVEIGPARIAVRPGFDRETLAAVVEVLAAAGAMR